MTFLPVLPPALSTPPPSLPASRQARLPELEELQRQLSATNEELTDLKFTVDELTAAAEARQAELEVCPMVLKFTLSGL